MSKQAKTSTQRFLKTNQNCCYCGGDTSATIRDHVVPKVVFDKKHRPKGLEAPACEPCQKFIKKHELVAGMFARVFPDSQARELKRETARIMRRVDRAVPGLLDEMIPLETQEARLPALKEKEPRAAGVFNMKGPLVNESLGLFGAKITCGLHYLHTGTIVPLTGAIAVRVYANVDAIEGTLSGEIFKMMGEPMTLTQGKWSVGDQFSYQTAIPEGARLAAYFSTFRMSFAVLAFVLHDASDLPAGAGMRTYAPLSFGGFEQIR